jgi:putative endonuclease
MDRSEIGRRGEDAAAVYLERQGMEIIDRNWRTGRGEIDIIALDEDTLVMCEVKTRTSHRSGTPEEAVSETKRKRLSRLARSYLAVCSLEPCPVRFDVVSIDVISADRALLRHHRAAFTVE